MRASRWSVVPAVLVLLLYPSSPVPVPALPDDTGNRPEWSADGVENTVAVTSIEQAVLGSGGSGAGGAGSGGVGGSVSGGGVPVCGVTGVTVMLPRGDRAEYRLCRRVESSKDRKSVV